IFSVFPLPAIVDLVVAVVQKTKIESGCRSVDLGSAFDTIATIAGSPSRPEDFVMPEVPMTSSPGVQ
ncbi:MAG TPA: hypothetical protein VEX68_21415, partial [Bryobacteraceae bacterium]|nr:hypothetical protein [Bryobacteraceae bacterium]